MSDGVGLMTHGSWLMLTPGLEASCHRSFSPKPASLSPKPFALSRSERQDSPGEREIASRGVERSTRALLRRASARLIFEVHRDRASEAHVAQHGSEPRPVDLPVAERAVFDDP